MLAVLAIVQMALHYLGWLGVILGIVAFIFGNRDRALDLVVGGFGLIVLKYILGFVLLGLFGLGKKRAANSPSSGGLSELPSDLLGARSSGSESRRSDADFELTKLALALLSDEARHNEMLHPTVSQMAQAGEACDEVAGSSGEFGTTPSNPIPVNGVIGELLYLSSLRCVSGRQPERVFFHRLGSVSRPAISLGFGPPFDVYETVSGNGRWGFLFFDAYHPRKSRKAPDRYVLATPPGAPFLFTGTHLRVEEFPGDVARGCVVAAVQRFFGVAETQSTDAARVGNLMQTWAGMGELLAGQLPGSVSSPPAGHLQARDRLMRELVSVAGLETTRLKPDDAEAHLERAIARARKDDFDGALDDATVAIRLNPQDAAFHWNRGVIHGSKGDLDSAIRDFNEAIRLDPECAIAYYNRGTAHCFRGDLNAGLKDFTEVIRLNPDNRAAYYNRGTARMRMGDLDEALKDYTEVIRLNPEDADAYLDRGTAREHKGDLGGALRDFTEAIRLNRNSAEAYYHRGMLLARVSNAPLPNSSPLISRAAAVTDLQRFVDLGGAMRNGERPDVEAMIQTLRQQ